MSECAEDMRGRASRVVFTSYGNIAAPAALVEWLTCSKVLYAVWSLEQGGKENKLHVQGYMRLSETLRYAAVKKLLHDQTAHIEFARAREGKNRDYCTKDSTHVAGPWEVGVFNPNAGKKLSYMDFVKMVDEGKTLRDMQLADPESFRSCRKDIINYRHDTEIPQPLDCQVFVLYTPPGIGKSKIVNNLFGYEKVYIHKVYTNKAFLWFENYDRHPILMLDEFQGENSVNQDYLNQLLDEHPKRIQVKFSSGVAYWHTVFICTNVDPLDWYRPGIIPADKKKMAEDLYQSVQRRLTHVIRANTRDELYDKVTSAVMTWRPAENLVLKGNTEPLGLAPPTPPGEASMVDEPS